MPFLENQKTREARQAKEIRKAQTDLRVAISALDRSTARYDRNQQEARSKALAAAKRNDVNTVRSQAQQILQFDTFKKTIDCQKQNLSRLEGQQLRAQMTQQHMQQLKATNKILNKGNVNPENIAMETAQMADHEQAMSLNESMLESNTEPSANNDILNNLVSQIMEESHMDQFRHLEQPGMSLPTVTTSSARQMSSVTPRT